MRKREATTSLSGSETGGAAYDAFISYSHDTDSAVAPRLQSGLQRFAKPWWQRQAVRVFRDESSLAANPHLWSSITEAMDASEWMVLLLSPEAAASQWVNREVEHWLEHRPANRILPVLTAGEFTWEGEGFVSNAAPPALAAAFSEEPRWVDLRFAHTDEQLDLRNARFRDAVADIAAAIRGVPKDELESEEIRQHKRTVRTAWAAGFVVVVLAVLASAAALFALDQRDEAEAAAQAEAEQRELAETHAASEADQRRIAEAAAQAEAEQRKLAEDAAKAEEEQRKIAERNEQLAGARALGASAQATMDDDPELAAFLAMLAVEIDPTPQHMSTLHAALQQHRSIAYGETGIRGAGALFGYLSPDGTRFAGGAKNNVLVWDVDAPAEPLWHVTVPGGNTRIEETVFSADGESVVFWAYWRWEEGPRPEGYPQGIYVLDAETGGELSFTPIDACGGIVLPGYGVDPAKPVTTMRYMENEDGICDWGSTQVVAYDLPTGDATELTPILGSIPDASADGRYVAFGDPARVIDTGTGEEVFNAEGSFGAISPDGRMVFVGSDLLELWVVGDDEPSAVFAPGDIEEIGFSADGSRFYLKGSEGRRVYEISGPPGFLEIEEIMYVRDGRAGLVTVFSADGRRLSSTSADGTWRVWDVAHQIQGETATNLIGPYGSHKTGTIAATDSLLSLFAWDWDVTGRAALTLFDPSGKEEVFRFDSMTEGALSADGAVVAFSPMLEDVELTDAATNGAAGVYQKVDPLRVHNLETGEYVEMQGLCTFYNGFWTDNEIPGEDCGEYPEPFMELPHHVALSPNGSLVAATGTTTGGVTVWDASSGELLWHSGPLQEYARFGTLAFSPDSRHLVFALSSALRVFDARTGQETATIERGIRITRPVFSPVGRRLYGAEIWSGEVSVFDTSDWSELDPIEIGGGILDIAINPGGSRLAAVGEGFVTVVALDTGHVEHIELGYLGNWGSLLNNVAFIDEHHLVVAPITPGPVFVMTLDAAELTDVARARMTRGLTDEECATYAIEPCPTLEEIRDG